MGLKAIYFDLLQQLKISDTEANILWDEIETKHSEKGRHYHNLSHLEDIYHQLLHVQSHIDHWEASLFALFYHDIIYNVMAGNNEKKSAELARKRMSDMKIEEEMISLTETIILATQKHGKGDSIEVDFFTDADLSILGADAQQYSEYCKKIRKEYSIYPDFMYNKGRKKVIRHFLNMDVLFKTKFFYDTYETKARANLKQELESL